MRVWINTLGPQQESIHPCPVHDELDAMNKLITPQPHFEHLINAWVAEHTLEVKSTASSILQKHGCVLKLLDHEQAGTFPPELSFRGPPASRYPRSIPLADLQKALDEEQRCLTMCRQRILRLQIRTLSEDLAVTKELLKILQDPERGFSSFLADHPRFAQAAAIKADFMRIFQYLCVDSTTSFKLPASPPASLPRTAQPVATDMLPAMIDCLQRQLTNISMYAERYQGTAQGVGGSCSPLPRSLLLPRSQRTSALLQPLAAAHPYDERDFRSKPRSKPLSFSPISR